MTFAAIESSQVRKVRSEGAGAAKREPRHECPECSSVRVVRISPDTPLADRQHGTLQLGIGHLKAGIESGGVLVSPRRCLVE